MRPAPKASLYRQEVTEAAMDMVLTALERFQEEGFQPEPLDYFRPEVRGHWRPPAPQDDRRIDWAGDNTETVLRKIRGADRSPRVWDTLFGRDLYLYDAHPEGVLRGSPGEVIAHSGPALCRATHDGAV